MDIYVDIKAKAGGDGSKSRPFIKIINAASIAKPGDTIWVSPGLYRESVDPLNSGTEDSRITYVSVEPLGAVISGPKGYPRGNIIQAMSGSQGSITVCLEIITLIRRWYMATGILLRRTSIRDACI